jgi:RHS repeat-associated protein
MSVINYLWNPLTDNIIEEYDDGGNTITEYTTEPGHFGNVVSQNHDDAERFFHYDGVGSTLALTDSDSNVTDTRCYTAFGETTQSSGSTSFSLQYVGQKGYYRDEETAKYIVRRRFYADNSGRWTTCDPLEVFESFDSPGVAGDFHSWIKRIVRHRNILRHKSIPFATRAVGQLNAYGYCVNAPENLIDPSGLYEQCSAPVSPGPTGINNYAQCIAACNAMGKIDKHPWDAAKIATCVEWCNTLRFGIAWGCDAVGKFCYTLKGKQAIERCLLFCRTACAGVDPC